MKSILCERLNFKLPPVGIYFTDEKPEGAFQAKKGMRVCAASMLVAAAQKNTVSVFDEETYGCAGGGVGLCFGNAFQKKGHPTDALLSRGNEVFTQRGELPPHDLGKGERFFATAELVRKWANSVPYTETAQKYVVFQPFLQATENNPPDLVHFFANPDQLSVLVISAGYYRGTALNVIAPFASACQSILLAYQEIGKEMPRAILGYFDISQRASLPKELLSMVVPYELYLEMERGAADGCMQTPAWEKICRRWD